MDAVQAPSVGGIVGKLRDYANAADPRNVVNAFRPTTMQAGADRILDFMAANPGRAAFARSARAFTKGAERGMVQRASQYANADDPSQQ